MPSPGKSIMAIWHGISPAYLEEFRLWHTKEHIPDRVSVPGFEGGRRYENPSNSSQPFFTMYVGDSVEAFRSEVYLARVREPTRGTSEAMKHFTNFARCACEVIECAGSGMGNCIMTIRLNFEDGGKSILSENASEIARHILDWDGVNAVHIALAKPDVMNSPTKDVSEEGFDALILIEGVSQDRMTSMIPLVKAYLEKMPLVELRQTDVYNIAYAMQK